MAHTDSAASSDLYLAKAPEGDGEGGDGARDDVADDHDTRWVRWHEFRRHAV